jgi:hypothetical protein
MRSTPLIFALALAALATAGCATTNVDALSVAHATASEADEQGLVIVTVDNGDSGKLRRPGSTRPAYSAARYQASDAARATMRKLALEYGLTEVAAWPISALQVHCAVFRIAPRQLRALVL